tara:strand:+ start:360 stop:593 length:234 start_codon:yes stop_codon:yes gene_type:complete
MTPHAINNRCYYQVKTLESELSAARMEMARLEGLLRDRETSLTAALSEEKAEKDEGWKRVRNTCRARRGGSRKVIIN